MDCLTKYFLKLCKIEEIDGSSKDNFNKSNTQYPCVPENGYYGCGPLQIAINLVFLPVSIFLARA